MTRISAIIDSAERAYDLSTAGGQWLQEVVEALRPALDHGLGIFGWEYDARDFKSLVFTNPVFMGIPPELPAALVSCTTDPDTPASLTQRHYRTPAGPFSMSLGEQFAQYRPWRRFIYPLGVKDLIVINGVDANRRGSAISAPRRSVTRLSPERIALLQRFSGHLATATRLRRRFARAPQQAPGPSHPRVEAVLAPNGKVEHAKSDAKQRLLRESLARAVKSAERARGKLRRTEPNEALKIWRSMVEGRWTLSDHFESDGRRYILAYLNPPEAPPMKALTPFERQVLSCTALGKSNKLIAYELGVSLTAVSSALKRASTKCGAKRPRDLLAILDRVLEAPTAAED